jgi:hypothetical protein
MHSHLPSNKAVWTSKDRLLYQGPWLSEAFIVKSMPKSPGAVPLSSSPSTLHTGSRPLPGLSHPLPAWPVGTQFLTPRCHQQHLGTQEARNLSIHPSPHCFSPGTPITDCVLPPLSGLLEELRDPSDEKDTQPQQLHSTIQFSLRSASPT